MLKSRTKRLLAFLMSIAVAVSVYLPYRLETSANASLSSISVKWANPQKIKKINKKQNEAVITANVNGTATNIYVSFPTEGGVRVRTDVTSGQNVPKSLKNIDYYNMPDGTMLLDAGDVAVKLNYAVYPWSMKFLDSKGKTVHTVTSRQVYFGFKNNVLRKVKLEGPVTENEVIYGLGESYNGTNMVGSTRKLWNVDTAYHTAAASVEKVNSYANIPLLNSSNGYTVFFNTYYGGYADVGDSDSEKWSLEFNGTDFDFFVYTEAPSENLESYTNLTGKPYTAPKWALGYWIGNQAGYWNSDDKDAFAGKLDSNLKQYKEMGTMPTAVFLEGIGGNTIDVLDVANSYGVKTFAWYNPCITLVGDGSNWGGLGLENLRKLLPGVADMDLPAPHNYDNTSILAYWGDFSNPLITTALKNGGFDAFLNKGLSGAMIDYGEYIEENMSFFNGMKGDEMHNYYAKIYTKTIYDIFNEKKSGDFILFARAGTIGSQIYGANFGGDQPTTFDGLRQAYYGGLNLSASGFSLWGSDIGGLNSGLTTQLYLRWLQFGTFSPLMRTHGASSRDPWTFGEIGKATFKRLYWTRQSLLDFLYSANLKSGKTGVSMMQSLSFAFPEQKSIASVSDQYMFCDELMVCPVLNENSDYIQVTFPAGKWTNLWNGKTYKGGTIQEVEATANTIPVYLRDGAVVKATVGPNFEMDEDMNSVSYDAVIAAPSTAKRSVQFVTDSKTYSFTNTPDGDNGFTVTNDSSHSAKLVIAAGVTASEVKVNGKAVKKLSELPKNDNATGYYVDYENRRTLVFTGGWKSVSVTDSNMALENLALNAKVTGKTQVISDQLESVVDGDCTSAWMVNSTEDSMATFDLGKLQSVKKLVLDWSIYSPDSYKLEVSANGSTDWKNIDVTPAGGTEAYTLSGDKIRYIRLSEIVINEDMPFSGLIELAAYGDSLIDESEKEEESGETYLPVNDDTSFDYSADTDNSEIETENTEETDQQETTKKKYKKVVVVDEGGFDTLTVVLIVVGCVVAVAAGVTVFIILFRKKKMTALTKK